MASINRKLPAAIKFALFAGASAAALVSGNAIAQGQVELERIEVTGSRIKRADLDGPNPVTVISRDDIEATGQLSIADIMRDTVYNSFGSTRESSGSSTGSFATVNLRGIGAQYTLVLMDGKRISNAATIDGGAVNMNMIPMAAVERVEILRDGASAVYGSDAVGGVVNIITRKDFEGLVISGGMEDPSSGPDGNHAALFAGINSDRGNVTFTFDHQERNMLYNRDTRDMINPAWWNAGLSGFSSSAAFTPAPGNPLGLSGTRNVDNCDDYENNIRTSAPGAALTRCLFDHGATSANESSLSRDSLFLNGYYALEGNTEVFFRGMMSRTTSLGVYASAPVAPTPILTIAANNPFNPFGVDGTLAYRFTPLGTRDSHRKDEQRDYTVGLRGSVDWFGGSDWETYVSHGTSTQNSVNYNYGIGSILQSLITAGQYNPFDPTHPSVAAAAPLVGHTVFVESEFTTMAAGANLTFDLFELPAGAVGIAVGGEYAEHTLEQIFDAQSAAGNVFGSAGAGTGGDREYYAGYVEALFPLFDKLNMTLAARYDSYNDVGSELSPRVSVEFRPLDSLLLRGSWGEGFAAPSLADMYGATSPTNLASQAITTSSPPHPGGDELACAALTAVRADPNVGAGYQPYLFDPCLAGTQYQFLVASNPFLEPEQTTNWSVGVVWSPLQSLSFSVDYFNIEIEEQVTTIPRALAFRFGDQGQAGYEVVRDPSFNAPNGVLLPGRAQSILWPVANAASRTAKGVDFVADWRMDTSAAGEYSARLAWSRNLEFDFTPAVGGTIEESGLIERPEDRGMLTLGWGLADFDATLGVNYIGSSGSGTTYMPDWTTFDIQAGWDTPWDGRLAVGVRNLTDEPPNFHLSVARGFPFYNNGLYNIWGRSPYVRYEQRF